MLLPGEPPTFLSHFALPFGSVGSVWGYLRVADVVAFLSVSLLFTFAAHYVDDSFSVEQALFAESSFAAFQAFHRMLGFRMKEAKSKPPSKTHTLLGIDWTFDNEYVRAEPGPARIARLVSTIQGFWTRTLCPQLGVRLSRDACALLALGFSAMWAGRFFSPSTFANIMVTRATACSTGPAANSAPSGPGAASSLSSTV